MAWTAWRQFNPAPPRTPPTCMRRRTTSKGYEHVWDTRPATAPHDRSRVVLCLLKYGMYVGAWRFSVPYVRNETPAYGIMPSSVIEKPR